MIQLGRLVFDDIDRLNVLLFTRVLSWRVVSLSQVPLFEGGLRYVRLEWIQASLNQPLWALQIYAPLFLFWKELVVVG